MPKPLRTLLAAALVAAAAPAAHADAPIFKDFPNVITLAVFGDSPYGTSNSDTAQFLATPAFIKTINDDAQVSMVVHVGDTHSGKQSCTAAYNQSIFEMWKAFRTPLVYVPGDNEWTDCNKAGEGGTDPMANLKNVRDIFFAQPGHTLGADLTVWTQAKNFDPKYPTDAAFVENVIFERQGVVFVTLNVPGGSNNDDDNWYGKDRTQAQTDEIVQRTSADLRWLDQAFGLAKDIRARAVVISLQADMWDLDGKVPLHIANYRQFIDSIALHTTVFGRPVLLFNGDSHGYRSDNPLVEGAPCVTESGAGTAACADDAYANQPNGYNVPNFHRIVVHGSTAPMEWVKLTIVPGNGDGRSGPDRFGPFSWQRMVQALP